MIKTFKLKDLKFMEFNQCIPNPLFVNQILVLKCNPISSNLEIGIGQYFYFFFLENRASISIDTQLFNKIISFANE